MMKMPQTKEDMSVRAPAIELTAVREKAPVVV